MSVLVFSNNSPHKTHVLITDSTYGDVVAAPVLDVSIARDPYDIAPDFIRLYVKDRNYILKEFNTADTNLVGATTDLRVADLINTYLQPPVTAGSSTSLTMIDISNYPGDPPYFTIRHTKFETTSATDTFSWDMTDWISPEVTTKAFIKMRVELQAFEPTASTPIDVEVYDIAFEHVNGAGAVSGIAPVRTRISTGAVTNYIDDFDYTASTYTLDINVICGSAPSNTRYELVLTQFTAHNVL